MTKKKNGKIKKKSNFQSFHYLTHPIMKALPKLFVFSLRKYMQAAKETATCTRLKHLMQRKKG
jgi:hypothetical protein